ncbi:melanopsin-like [Asterias amurensis]|uniref:melanopsin-like n=1 Tax=Asterias amurensis TaxID=7602 RepID=UPI003AB56129
MENKSAMFESVLSNVEIHLVSTLLLIVAVVGTIGNILVILAFGLSRKLHNTTNCFVVNLSVADLITCLNIPINAAAMLSPHGLIPDWICILCGFCSVTCIGCGVYNLTCIAVYRLVLVSNRQPHHTGRAFTHIVVSIIIGTTWLIPLTMASIPFVFGFGELGYNPKYSSCTWKTSSSSTELDSYSFLLAVTYYPIPTFIIITSYAKLFIHLKGHRKRVIPLQRSEECSHPVQPAQRGARKSSQKVVTKNMFYVVCAFLVCMTPYSVCLVVSGSDFFIPYAVVFLLASSCVNPVIYATKHPHFSIVMRSIITCSFKKIPHFVLK